MSIKTAKNIISTMGVAARTNRLNAADYFIQNPDEFSYLLNLVFDKNYKNHYRAAWVLEFVLEKELDWILPYLDFFTKNLHLLTNDSALRSISKICKWIAEAFVEKENFLFTNKLTKKHIDLIVESNFDWLIGAYRIAVKVHTMDTLYLFGMLNFNNLKWIHQELQNIISLHIADSSPGYKSHGKMILKRLLY